MNFAKFLRIPFANLTLLVAASGYRETKYEVATRKTNAVRLRYVHVRLDSREYPWYN